LSFEYVNFSDGHLHSPYRGRAIALAPIMRAIGTN
jgi:hypothetical protein